jgi:hypothetical protein
MEVQAVLVLVTDMCQGTDAVLPLSSACFRKSSYSYKSLLFLFRICQTLLAKVTNIKFYKHVSVGSWAVLCGQVDVTRVVVTI